MTANVRIWWTPRVPKKFFYIPAKTLEEAKLILGSLALYDIFQAGGLQVQEGPDDEWEDYKYERYYERY